MTLPLRRSSHCPHHRTAACVQAILACASPSQAVARTSLVHVRSAASRPWSIWCSAVPAQRSRARRDRRSAGADRHAQGVLISWRAPHDLSSELRSGDRQPLQQDLVEQLPALRLDDSLTALRAARNAAGGAAQRPAPSATRGAAERDERIEHRPAFGAQPGDRSPHASPRRSGAAARPPARGPLSNAQTRTRRRSTRSGSNGKAKPRRKGFGRAPARPPPGPGL